MSSDWFWQISPDRCTWRWRGRPVVTRHSIHCSGVPERIRKSPSWKFYSSLQRSMGNQTRQYGSHNTGMQLKTEKTFFEDPWLNLKKTCEVSARDVLWLPSNCVQRTEIVAVSIGRFCADFFFHARRDAVCIESSVLQLHYWETLIFLSLCEVIWSVLFWDMPVLEICQHKDVTGILSFWAIQRCFIM